MPSNRRLKTVATFAVVIFLAYLYFGSSSSSDRDFYERSVAGMAARAKDKAGAMAGAGGTKPSPQIPPPAPEAESTALVKDNSFTPDRRPKQQVALGEDDDTEVVKAKGKEKGGKTDEEHEVEAELNSILKRAPIIIFSKSYCPFSMRAKKIFNLYSITPAPFVVELDQHKLMGPLQDQLQKFTGRRTVPNILISGTSIGGGDDVDAMHKKGELVQKIKEIGGKRIMEVRLKGIKEK